VEIKPSECSSTRAPATAAPFSSITRPEMVTWADNVAQENIKHIRIARDRSVQDETKSISPEGAYWRRRLLVQDTPQPQEDSGSWGRSTSPWSGGTHPLLRDSGPVGAVVHEGEEFVAGFFAVAECAEHRAGHRARVLFFHSPHHHAEVARFADHAD